MYTYVYTPTHHYMHANKHVRVHVLKYVSVCAQFVSFAHAVRSGRFPSRKFHPRASDAVVHVHVLGRDAESCR